MYRINYNNSIHNKFIANLKTHSHFIKENILEIINIKLTGSRCLDGSKKSTLLLLIINNLSDLKDFIRKRAHDDLYYDKINKYNYFIKLEEKLKIYSILSTLSVNLDILAILFFSERYDQESKYDGQLLPLLEMPSIYA